MKILFWSFVALDVAALVLFGLLALAAAGPSRTQPLAALVVPVLLPALLLAGAVAVFLNARGDGARWFAVALAAAPLLLTVGSRLLVAWELSGHTDGAGGLHQFRTPAQRELEAAVERGDAAVIATLAVGVDLDAPGLSGAPLLVLALRRLPRDPRGLEVVRALLAAGADPDVAHAELPLQPAIAATRTLGIEPVRVLLDAGADPNARGEGGRPAFFVAGGAGVDVAVLELLAAHGADVTARDDAGCSAAATAALTGNWPALEFLVQRGAPWRDQPGSVGSTLVEFVESEARRAPRPGEDQAALARVLELLRAG
jgi:hypothetical protein